MSRADEVSWRKQHRYLTLVVNHERRQVVWGTEGSGEKAADEFFSELDPELHADLPQPQAAEIQQEPSDPPDPQCDVPDRELPVGERAAKLRAISMDMGPGYAKSARNHAPQAIVCIDPYHVVQLVSKNPAPRPRPLPPAVKRDDKTAASPEWDAPASARSHAEAQLSGLQTSALLFDQSGSECVAFQRRADHSRALRRDDQDRARRRASHARVQAAPQRLLSEDRSRVDPR